MTNRIDISADKGVCLKWASSLSESGLFEDAEQIVRRILSHNGDDHLAHSLLASILIKQKKYHHAAESIDVLQRANPFDDKVAAASDEVLSGITTHPEEKIPNQIVDEFFPYAYSIISAFGNQLDMPALNILNGNRHILANKIIFPFTHHSFGHPIIAIDWASRTFFPNKLCFVIIPSINDNEFMPTCFSHNVIVARINLEQEHRNRANEVSIYKSLHYVLMLYASFCASRGIHVRIVVYDEAEYMESMPVLCRMSDHSNDLVYRPNSATGYSRLIKNKVGHPARLPMEYVELCRSRISGVYPEFFNRPLICMLLRKKGAPHVFSDFSRSAGSSEGYARLIQFLIASGYHVAGTGETDNDSFKNIPGYYDLRHIDLNPKLINVFLLTNSVLFIGQQSGPFVLASAAEIPCLITDALPHRVGTFGKRDINLYKDIYLKDRDTPLSLVEIYRTHLDIACGADIRDSGASVVNNSTEQLLDAAREALDMLKDPTSLSQMRADGLAERLRAIMPYHLPVRVHASRPPASVLESLLPELERIGA